MFQKKESDIEISISDPSQKFDEIQIFLNNYKVLGNNISKKSKKIKLTKVENAGMTQKFYIQK